MLREVYTIVVEEGESSFQILRGGYERSFECQYLYFCTDKTQKLSTPERRFPMSNDNSLKLPLCHDPIHPHFDPCRILCVYECQYLYFCTSKLSTPVVM